MTKEEIKNLLALTQAKLKEQGRIVDDRLLQKARELERLLISIENSEKSKESE